MPKATLLFATFSLVCTSSMLLAQDRRFSVQGRFLGGAGFCTNAGDFTNADTRRILPEISWTVEVVGLYNVIGDRVYISTGLGLTGWRYNARLREDLLAPFSYEGARQGPGGGSFTIPARAGVRIGDGLSVEAGWVFMRHMGRAPAANDFYALRNGNATLSAEASNYRTRFSNSLAEVTLNYRVAQRAMVHLRGGMALQDFPGVRVIENILASPSASIQHYMTEGAARLGFASVGVGYEL